MSTEEPGCAVGVGANNTIIMSVQDSSSCIAITLSKEQAEITVKLLLLCLDTLPKEQK